jgi:hypothetical protein
MLVLNAKGRDSNGHQYEQYCRVPLALPVFFPIEGLQTIACIKRPTDLSLGDVPTNYLL